MTTSHVELHADGILINGEPQVLLTSSLFYFRLPAFEWRNRMRTLKKLGYNTIDVYFPWNYHELAPDQWDFSGERDVRSFLQMACDEGLWVVARPGPYICSEWDGGALPAYLNTIPGIQLRDNDPTFLQGVQKWYDHILPIIAEFQIERGGTIVMMQLDNELDFFDCNDRPGYLSALRDMALGHDITVPLIACSGQGDIPGATGNAEGVVPTCNVYFDSRDPQLEPRVRHYSQTLRARGYPLCITETNRSHTDLRRLLAGGAKLLGPYLQTSGTDFGFTTSVTNWGDPLSLMTSHYDFGGMISPGGKVRPDGREALAFSKMINALGPALALSEAVDSPPQPVRGVDAAALALEGGGWLVGLPNPGEKPVEVHIENETGWFPAKISLTVAPNTCPFMLVDFPLSRWGMDAHVAYSTAELVGCVDSENSLELTFSAGASVELMIRSNEGAPENVEGWQFEPAPEGWRLWLESGSPARAEFSCQAGKKLLLFAVSREEISSLENAGLEAWQVSPEKPESIPAGSDWLLEMVDPCVEEWFKSAKPCLPGELHLEHNHIYRGFGWYRTVLPAYPDTKGLMIHSGGDVLSIYVEKRFIGTLTPGGGQAYLPLTADTRPDGTAGLVIRAEIWGHANFDDHRLPALRLNALRGMGGMTAIRSVENLTPNWFYHHRAQTLATKIDPAWPMLYFGGWSTTDEPSQGVYYRDVAFAAEMDTRILHFPGLQVDAKVFVSGQFAGQINPLNPYIDISPLTPAGEKIRVAIIVDQPFRRPAGEVVLYQGQSVSGWEVAGWGESELAGLARHHLETGESAMFPLVLPRGDMAWLHADLPLSADWERGWGLQLAGQGMKVSAWLGEHLVGRIWLPSEMRPRMAGGLDDRMVLPSAWVREAGGKLHLLLESVSNQPVGELSAIKFIQEI